MSPLNFLETKDPFSRGTESPCGPYPRALGFLAAPQPALSIQPGVPCLLRPFTGDVVVTTAQKKLSKEGGVPRWRPALHQGPTNNWALCALLRRTTGRGPMRLSLSLSDPQLEVCYLHNKSSSYLNQF